MSEDGPGASFVHSRIVGNLVRLLGNLVLDRACVVLPPGMRVHVPRVGGCVCPDVSVVCGAPVFIDGAGDVLANPCVVIEVMSSATEQLDRGENFVGYRSLGSLVDFVLVTPDQRRLEHYVRGDADTWVLRDLGPGSVLRLAGLEGEIPVDEIYLDVQPG